MNAPENRETVPGFPEIGRGSWIESLRSQLRQAAEERKHPAEKIELSATQDPEALQKLIDMENPFMSVLAQVRAAVDEFRHPREKFEPTAQPIETDQRWSASAHNPRVPGLLAVGVHLAMVGLLLVPLLFPPRQAIQVTETYVPLFTPVRLELPPMEELSGGGGGGGLETDEPPLLGEIPEAAEQQFVPPSVEELPARMPLIVMPPTIVAPQLTDPDRIIDLAMLGAPDGIPGPPSAGPGAGGGIGTGQGTGIGEGGGTGLGEGEGGGFGGGVYQVGGGVSEPVVIWQVQPEYSEEARKARYEGVVRLDAIIHKDGSIQILRVLRSLGFGLDEKAIEALEQWKFRPGMRGGEPVAVSMNIEVTFNLR